LVVRDLLDILAATAGPLEHAAVLATVVRVEGSSYRLPAARMLIDATGQRIGSVSGGCLEADVARRGRLLSDQSPNALLRYDGSDEDAAWGFGLGCNGSIEVFIERLADRAGTAMEFIRQCVRQRTAGALITVFRVDGDVAAGVLPGARLMMTDVGTAADGVGSPGLLELFTSDARGCLAGRETSTVVYELNGGTARVHALVEAVRPPTPLVIFGAGHDAVPLVRAAKQIGWHVTVVDRRPGYAKPERFPLADAVVACDLDAVDSHVSITTDTVAVVMTHHYPDDRVLIERLLSSPARYVGALGPRARTDRILSECAQAGANFSSEQLARLYAPIGLDIGAEGPDQVALAVVAEIISAMNNRPGGPLRDRRAPIHEPANVRVVTMPQGAPHVHAGL
jgi:xanthine/CO dehydrogenase XdhC/CoxF family maturation factor